MNITKTVADNRATLSLQGRLDTTTAPTLEAEINALEAEITELVLDLSELEYVSSAGLRVVLGAHKKMSRVGGMKVTSVSDIVMEVFEITGFVDLLTIE